MTKPHFFPNMLNCFKKAIGLAGIYMFTSASCKKDFNKGVLPVAYIWSHIKRSNRIKHHNLKQISQLLVRDVMDELIMEVSRLLGLVAIVAGRIAEESVGQVQASHE